MTHLHHLSSTSTNHTKSNSESILIQSLKAENDILRSELQSTTKYSTQLRQQLKLLDGADEERNQLKQVVNQLNTQISQFQEVVDNLNNENTSLKMKTKHLSDTIGLETQRLEKEHSNHYSKIIKYSVRVLRGVLDEMQNFHRAWLPTYHSGLEKELLKEGNTNRFRVASNIEIEKPDFISPHLQSSFHSALPRDGSVRFQDTLYRSNKHDNEIEILDLYELLERVDRSILMMKLLGDSKIESVTLVHKELKAQNTELLSKSNTATKAYQKLQNIHEKKLIEFQTIKNDLRTQMEQLQSLYEKQKLDLNNKLKQSRIQIDTQNTDIKELENQIEVYTKELKKLQKEYGELEDRAMEQETARITLADELERERQMHQITQKEVENLKMIQKFFRNGSSNGESIENVPKEKVDLMKTINHLMEENRKLKDTNMNNSITIRKYETQLKLAQNTNNNNSNVTNKKFTNGGQSLMASTPLNQDLHLIASDKLSDAQLTHKILARKIQEDRSQRINEDRNNTVGKFGFRNSSTENFNSVVA